VKGCGTLVVEVVPRKNGVRICSNCGLSGCPGYDTQSERLYEFVPILGMKTYFRYSPRRVACRDCGVCIERVPWSDGKSPLSIPFMLMLASWARVLSYSGVARHFGCNYHQVFAAVHYVVSWGMVRRDLTDITAIGVDEIQVKVGHVYMTLVYQIDAHCKRLLWTTCSRKEVAFREFFSQFEAILPNIKYVCSDMWRPYVKVIQEQLPHAMHVLDRFHIVQNLNKAIETVRRQETVELKSKGYEPYLKGSRWCLLKRKENLTKKQRGVLKELLQYNLRSTRAYLLKASFDKLWSYNSPKRAEEFIDFWTTTVMRSRIDPLKKFAKTLRTHKTLILNYFRCKKQLSAGTVEGLNSVAKLAMRKSFGFRTENALNITLFHTLGKLPEPELAHRLW
jgi:transposase